MYKYSPAMITGKNLIGYNVSGNSGNTFASSILENDAVSSFLFHEASSAEINEAVTLANKAFAHYKQTTVVQKIAFLEKIAESKAAQHSVRLDDFGVPCYR